MDKAISKTHNIITPTTRTPTRIKMQATSTPTSIQIIMSHSSLAHRTITSPVSSAPTSRTIISLSDLLMIQHLFYLSQHLLSLHNAICIACFFRVTCLFFFPSVAYGYGSSLIARTWRGCQVSKCILSYTFLTFLVNNSFLFLLVLTD